jgi:lipoprotein-anchoring transpeptidase ErfK/SrfK
VYVTGSTDARKGFSMYLTTNIRRKRAGQVLAGALLVTTLSIAGLGGVAHAAASRPAASKFERLTARTSQPLPIYAARGDASPVGVLQGTTEFGTIRVVLVLKQKGQWLKVRLPDRPNGSVGWIRESDVELRSVTDAVDIDLEARTLRWTRDGELVLETPIAVGASDTPTPRGRFYVTDLLDTPDGGSYGPFAAGVAAHSDELSEFGNGDGQIGVHGTSDPTSIGQAVSHGCVRVPNEVIAQLATTLPLGTPVTIR